MAIQPPVRFAALDLWLLLGRPTPPERWRNPEGTFPSQVMSSVSWTSWHIGRQRWRAATVKASSASSNPLLRKWFALCLKASRRMSRISRHIWSIFNVFHCWQQWRSRESGIDQRHELLADAINSASEKFHTLASIMLIQSCLEPNFVTRATYAPKDVINLHFIQQISSDSTQLFWNNTLNGFLEGEVDCW